MLKPNNEMNSNEVGNENTPAVLIAGGGPAGLASALVALEKGYPVVIVNKYAANIRKQRVKIERKQAQLFKRFADPNNSDDQKFLQKIKKNKYTLSIGSVEKFLQRKVNDKKYIGKVRQIEAGIDNKNSRLNKENNILEVEGKQIYFTHLIDATGGRRAVLNLANENHSDVDVKLKQPGHIGQGVALFYFDQSKLNENTDSTKILSEKKTITIVKFSNKQLQELKKLGWDKPYPPRVYIICNKEHNKFYLGGEVPENISTLSSVEEKQEAVQKWYQLIAKQNYGINTEDTFTLLKPKTEKENTLALNKNEHSIQLESIRLVAGRLHLNEGIAINVVQDRVEKYMQKHNLSDISKLTHEHIDNILKKYSLQLTSFSLTLTQAKHPVQQLNEKSNTPMIAIGDALQSPNFHRAHGLNDALRGVQIFDDCLPKKEINKSLQKDFDLDKMRDFAYSIKHQHTKRMNKYAIEKTTIKKNKMPKTNITNVNNIYSEPTHQKNDKPLYDQKYSEDKKSTKNSELNPLPSEAEKEKKPEIILEKPKDQALHPSPIHHKRGSSLSVNSQRSNFNRSNWQTEIKQKLKNAGCVFSEPTNDQRYFHIPEIKMGNKQVKTNIKVYSNKKMSTIEISKESIKAMLQLFQAMNGKEATPSFTGSYDTHTKKIIAEAYEAVYPGKEPIYKEPQQTISISNR